MNQEQHRYTAGLRVEIDTPKGKPQRRGEVVSGPRDSPSGPTYLVLVDAQGSHRAYRNSYPVEKIKPLLEGNQHLVTRGVLCPDCDGAGIFDRGDGQYVDCGRCEGWGGVNETVVEEKPVPTGQPPAAPTAITL